MKNKSPKTCGEKATIPVTIQFEQQTLFPDPWQTLFDQMQEFEVQLQQLRELNKPNEHKPD